MGSQIFVLDSGFLWLIVHPRAGNARRERIKWLKSVAQRGGKIVIPAIVYYETSRELIRKRARRQLSNLRDIRREVVYWPLTDEALCVAARLWAEARQGGFPTAEDRALDVDVILAAQTKEVAKRWRCGDGTVLVTENVRHLDRFCAARRWHEVG